MVCCSAVRVGFSRLAVEVELFDGFEAEFEPEFVVAVFEFDPGDPVNCLSLSPSPQNVSTNDMRPNVSIDFTENASQA